MEKDKTKAMRRNLEPTENLQILSSNYIGNLAYISGTSPYIVPMTYYYDRESHTLTSYSSEGHKIAAMRKNNTIALMVSQINSVANWQTVQVHGTFQELKGIDAKHMLHAFSEGIKNILSRTKGMESEYISEFSAKIESEGSPIVFRINIHEITGKKRES
ncbi:MULTISPECIES: pyridoxamine 5'-phosphate oxidase family protein [Maribacter]|uniref:Pyridoxamine 5'-phosphate oxidase family protein n=1 Tax=Maribacter flavus TaxID=1658664 RepID=A0ABU7IG48_9FLAO|nr:MULTISPECIES: pyridoxamine 5'-phosphate oxidase family protein [Maribacter]MDC6405272.1 pyridoxamine 5'-phosphate oxidase family protein [Maribacter sp. PR66]MEE1971919.1 pyridoxamine 5'-phosphate oxidase family protein [Maribacter flavus]